MDLDGNLGGLFDDGTSPPGDFGSKGSVYVAAVLGFIGLIVAGFYGVDYRLIIGGGSIFYLALLFKYALSD